MHTYRFVNATKLANDWGMVPVRWLKYKSLCRRGGSKIDGEWHMWSRGSARLGGASRVQLDDIRALARDAMPLLLTWIAHEPVGVVGPLSAICGVV